MKEKDKGKRKYYLNSSDWYCRKCDKGWASLDIEKSNGNKQPLCPLCNEIVVDTFIIAKEEGFY